MRAFIEFLAQRKRAHLRPYIVVHGLSHLLCIITIPQESDSSSTDTEDMLEKLQGLTIAPDASYLPSSETTSTASSVCSPDEAEELKTKLNTFLAACKLDTVGHKSWLEWDRASERTRRRYVNYAADSVAATLNVISPENSVHLWQALQSSKVINDKLGVESPSLPSEKAYLETPAEMYKCATSLGYPPTSSFSDGRSCKL